ncbi:MAG TPA: hypothetical protein VE866_17250 [Candidatus Binatia bacterium]|nr:hypothetical protein [Candidatus Binatia bacterium]
MHTRSSIAGSNLSLTPLTPLRLAGLFLLFLLIACGLGYPILNRYDPEHTPALSDVQTYAALVTGQPDLVVDHVRFRVLVPWLARPLYHLALGRSGSWNPVMLGLLFADSIFVAATALLILMMGIAQLGSYPTALVAALLYLVNFAVPNLRLAGLVDAGEGFFLLALFLSLAQSKLWPLPLIAILGALTKESFVPFMIVFTAAWWLVERKQLHSPVRSVVWIAGSWLVSLATITVLHWSITGQVQSPLAFAASLRGNHDDLHHFSSALFDRNSLYIFVWLLPLGIPRLTRFPKSWLAPVAATSLLVFALDAYYSGAPGTVGRALFTTAGPLLALSAASFLLG